MFTKPVQDLEFSDIESFCKIYREGIRVEYKESIPKKKLPKTISAFANTLGGILVLGVKANKVSNRAEFPIEGMEKKDGIEETITVSSLQGIYPAVFPEVKVLDVPDRSDRIVVVVKVHESIEAPHAIQNSTRVYIRTGSQSQPYELAEIDRIEYMLKRRQKPLERKQQIVSAAKNRYVRYRKLQKQTVPRLPTLQIAVSVTFPYQPIISLEQLDQFVQNIPPGDPVKFLTDYVKRVHEGICHPLPWDNRFEYHEINQYGLIFLKEDVDKVKSNWEGGSPEDEILYVSFPALIAETGRVLHLADLFFSQCGYLGNVEVKLAIDNILGEKLIFSDFHGIGREATDNQASALERFLVDEMRVNLTTVVSNLMKSILWVFNYDIARFGATQEMVKKTLVDNHLINKS